jgi:uncharacterized membrane protein AbrB (regulator of aidB expression)
MEILLVMLMLKKNLSIILVIVITVLLIMMVVRVFDKRIEAIKNKTGPTTVYQSGRSCLLT